MLAGILYERRHTYEISELGGLASSMPVYATFFLFVLLASVGLPLLNGFIGEFLVLSGAFQDRADLRNFWARRASSGVPGYLVVGCISVCFTERSRTQ